MAKSITIPEDYNVANNQCGTLTQVSGYNYNGSNVTTSQVKNALGESVSSVGALCTSNKINKWAAFKSGRWDGNDFTNGIFNFLPSNTGYRLGDFIGYNHNAKPPVYYYQSIPTTASIEQWSSLTIPVYLARGEADPIYNQIFGNINTCSKSVIDIQSTINDNTTHSYVSVPTTGSILKNIYIADTYYNTTLTIKPVYYKDLGYGKIEYMSIIEDGSRSINITVSPLKFSGTIEDLPDTTGGNPIETSLYYTITRTDNSSKALYFRIYASGTGIVPNYSNLGSLNFTGNETKNGYAPITIYSSTGTNTNVILHLEASNTYNFVETKSLAISSFNWTNVGGAV